MNIVVLRGTLSSDPRERVLPSGTTVINWEVTTKVDGQSRSVPVQWDEPHARVRACGEGDEIVVLGSVRRRFFRAGGATASRTEVLAEQMATPTQLAALTKLRDHAVTRLEG